MGSEDNKKIVERFWTAFSATDIETASSLISDDGFTWWIAGKPGKFPLAGKRSKAEFFDLLKGVAGNSENGLKVTPLAWTAEGDRVALEAESYGVFGGKVYNNFYHLLHIVRDGKIQSVKEYMDTMHANEVLCSQ